MARAALSLVLIGVIAAALTACKSAEAAGRESAKALAGEWVLDRLQGTDPVPAGARRPTLAIAQDGKVSGFAGVNRYSSSLDTVKLAKGDFAMSPAVATRMAGTPGAMALESKYLEALGRSTRYRIDGDHLVLSDASGGLLRFARGK